MTRIEEAWANFRAHLQIPDHDVTRACFFAGYVEGAHAVYCGAAEACKQTREEFRERIVDEVLAEREEAKTEAKPS